MSATPATEQQQQQYPSAAAMSNVRTASASDAPAPSAVCTSDEHSLLCFHDPPCILNDNKTPEPTRDLDPTTLGVDMLDLAKDMGKTLAIIHWVVRVDARNAEFMLAPPPAVHVMVVDYNDALPADDGDFVDAAVRGFVENTEGCFPKPCFGALTDRWDARHWEVFAEAYLEKSREAYRVVAGHWDSFDTLPMEFLHEVEEHYRHAADDSDNNTEEEPDFDDNCW